MAARSGGPARHNLTLGHPAIGLAFLLCVQLWYLHLWPTFHPANESIRFYFVEAVVEDGSLSIDGALDRYGVPNIDASVYEGRYYLDKAPGLSFVAVPPLALMWVAGLADRIPWLPRWTLLTLLCVTLPSLLSTALLYRFVRDISGREDAALGLATAYAVATPALLYSVLFFGHQLAAVLLLAAFYVLRPTSSDPIRPGRAAGAGFLMSYAVATEYQAIAAAAGLAVYGLVRSRSGRVGAALVAGGLVPAVALLSYHWVAFGGPLHFPYAYKAAPIFAAFHAKGVFGFSWPPWEPLYGQVLSARRGLAYCSPFLLLLPFAIPRMMRIPKLRATRWAVLWVGLGHVLFMSGYQYWTGGYCEGPRFLVPVIPFLILPLAALFGPDPAGRAMRVLRGPVLSGLVIVGVVLQLLVLVTFPYHPEELSTPFYELSLPLVLQGCFAHSALGLSTAAGFGGFAALVLLGTAWLLHRLRAGRPGSMNFGDVAGAVAVSILILGAQLLLAPPPDNAEARRWQNEARDLMQCGPLE